MRKAGCRLKSVSPPSVREPGHPGKASPFAGTVGSVENGKVKKRPLVGQGEVDELECNPRTLYRDLEALQVAGGSR